MDSTLGSKAIKSRVYHNHYSARHIFDGNFLNIWALVYIHIYICTSELHSGTFTLKLKKARFLNVPFHPFATDILLQCHLQRNVALCCLLGWLLCKLALLWNFAYTNNLKKIIIFRYEKLKIFLQCVISVKTLFKRTQQCTAALDNIVSIFRITITLMSVHN